MAAPRNYPLEVWCGVYRTTEPKPVIKRLAVSWG